MAMNRSANLIGNVPSRKWCPSRGSFSSLPRYNGRCTDSNIVVPSRSWVLLTDSQARSWPDLVVGLLLFYSIWETIVGLIIRHFDVFFRRPQILIPNSSSLNIWILEFNCRLYCYSFYIWINSFLKKIFSAHIRRSNIVQESGKYFSAVLLITLTLSLSLDYRFNPFFTRLLRFIFVKKRK